jgi:hypothetical protein
MKSLCFVAALVVFTAGCTSPASPTSAANDQTARDNRADTDAYILHGAPSRPPRLTVGTSYSDTQLILPWFLNDIIDFVNYR